MNPIKKVTKLDKKRINAKQKALKKIQTKNTLKQNRKLKQTKKKQKIHIQNKKAAQHVIQVQQKELQNLKVWTRDDIIKELTEIGKSCKAGHLTICWGIEKLDKEVEKRNKLLATYTKEKKVHIQGTNFPHTIYKPSKKAHAHHLYVEQCKKDNETKNNNYLALQKTKKALKVKNKNNSLNRLVCIKKGTQIARLPAKTALPLVNNENWEFTPKHYWKKARADKNTDITLLWSIGTVKLKSPINPLKLTARLKKAKRIKNAQYNKMIEKRILTRRKRKKIPLHNPIQIENLDNDIVKLIDTKNKKYYKFNKKGFKQAKEKYNTLHNIIRIIETKGLNAVIKGKLVNPTILHSYPLAPQKEIIKSTKLPKRNSKKITNTNSHLNLQRNKNQFIKKFKHYEAV